MTRCGKKKNKFSGPKSADSAKSASTSSSTALNETASQPKPSLSPTRSSTGSGPVACVSGVGERSDNTIAGNNGSGSNHLLNVASNRLEMILNELESGCLAEVAAGVHSKEAKADPVGFLRKKMAALGFQAGIQFSNDELKGHQGSSSKISPPLSGLARETRKILEGFPGDDENEQLTFVTLGGTDSESYSEDEEDEAEDVEQDGHLKNCTNVSETDYDDDDDDEVEEYEDEIDFDNNFLFSSANALSSEDFLLGLDPLRVFSNKLGGKESYVSKKAGKSAQPPASLVDLAGGGNGGLSYPLIDPLKLQVIQSAESELTTVHDLFESSTLAPSQKLPLLKRKYMELMQQDIRHRLESLRMRDYLDTLQLERQVVERELEKAMQLKSTMEQLCEQLQAENARIKSEKAGITSKLYTDLELNALIEDDGSKPNAKKKPQSQKGKKSNGNSSHSSSNSSSTIAFPNANLPDPIKSVSFEVPDASRLLDSAQGDLRARMTLLIELYNQREIHFMGVLKAKDTEIALLQGHFYSLSSQLLRLRQENREVSGQLQALGVSESDLRAQLSIYVDKFKQVEDTLAKSNDLFATFRQEMEQMTSKLGRLEKENQALQSKCSTLSRNIIEMADERTKQTTCIELLKSQKGKLESLCRSMQAERNAALQLNGSSSGGNVNDNCPAEPAIMAK